MTPIDIFVFVVFPYISLAIFILGVLYRFFSWFYSKGATGLYSVAVRPYNWGFGQRLGEVLKRIFVLYNVTFSDKAIAVGSFLFHWGIWIALLGHLAMIIPPEQFGVAADLHEAVALYVGGSAGVISLIGIVILLIRRIARADVRRISYLDDYFALILLLIIISLGLVQTLAVRPDYMHTVSPWLQSVLTGSPNASYMAEEHLVTKIHAFFAMLFIAYVPLGKMMHPFSFLIMPTLWNKPTQLYGYLLSKIRR